MRAALLVVVGALAACDAGANWADPNQPKPKQPEEAALANKKTDPDEPQRAPEPLEQSTPSENVTMACGKAQVRRATSGCANSAVGSWMMTARFHTGDSDYLITLHPDGRAESRDPAQPHRLPTDSNCAKCAPGKWRPAGDRIEIEINDYSCWVGECTSTATMGGDAQNVTGYAWRFVGSRK